MSSTRLYQLHSAEWAELDRSYTQRLARPGSTVDLAVPFYLVDHPDGKLLFDTGISTEMYEEPGTYGQFGAPEMERVCDALRDVCSPANELERIGYAPDDIDYVVLSHLHWDHAGNISEFSGAEVLVRQNELQYAWWPMDSIQQGAYLEGDLAVLKAPESTVQPISEEYDVFGDGVVVTFPTPGHTPGHQSLKIELDQAGTVILAGDVAHLRSVYEQEEVSPINWDVERSIQSCRTVKQMTKTSDATTLLFHDPEDSMVIPDEGLV